MVNSNNAHITHTRARSMANTFKWMTHFPILYEFVRRAPFVTVIIRMYLCDLDVKLELCGEYGMTQWKNGEAHTTNVNHPGCSKLTRYKNYNIQLTFMTITMAMVHIKQISYGAKRSLISNT